MSPQLEFYIVTCQIAYMGIDIHPITRYTMARKNR